MKVQLTLNGKFCMEHPAGASSWDQKCMKDMMKLQGARSLQKGCLQSTLAVTWWLLCEGPEGTWHFLNVTTHGIIQIPVAITWYPLVSFEVYTQQHLISAVSVWCQNKECMLRCIR